MGLQTRTKSGRFVGVAAKGASVAMRSMSTLGAKSAGAAGASGGGSIGKDIMVGLAGEAITNTVTGALACIPGIHTVPFIGDFLGLGPSQDMPNQELHDKLGGQMNKSFDDMKSHMNELAGEMNVKLDDISEELAEVKSDIAAVKQDVLDAIQNSADALTEVMKSSQVEIIKKITEEAAQTQEGIRVFRELAQSNHENLIFEIKEAQFEDHYLQCLEWSTNILAKYKIYDM